MRKHVLRRFVIHTDEGDIPVELTFDPTPWPHPIDKPPGIGGRVRPLDSDGPSTSQRGRARRRVPSRARGRG